MNAVVFHAVDGATVSPSPQDRSSVPRARRQRSARSAPPTIAGLVAGAVSIALGEPVPVASQRDAERSLIARERRTLEEDPEADLEASAATYRRKGRSEATARTVTIELTARDPDAALLDAQLGLNPDDLTNPVRAAISLAAGGHSPSGHPCRCARRASARARRQRGARRRRPGAGGVADCSWLGPRDGRNLRCWPPPGGERHLTQCTGAASLA